MEKNLHTHPIYLLFYWFCLSAEAKLPAKKFGNMLFECVYTEKNVRYQPKKFGYQEIKFGNIAKNNRYQEKKFGNIAKNDCYQEKTKCYTPKKCVYTSKKLVYMPNFQ